MTITTLDPTPALILIDLQKGIVALPTARPSADIVKNAAALATAARHRGLPVVLVNVAGGAPGRTERVRPSATPPADWTDLVPEVGALDSDIRITKQRWNAFSNPALHAALQERGVTQVMLAGIATSMGIESTARAAHEHGYHVLLVTDAMTDTDSDAHTNSVERIFPKLGERTSTNELIDLLHAAPPAQR